MARVLHGSRAMIVCLNKRQVSQSSHIGDTNRIMTQSSVTSIMATYSATYFTGSEDVDILESLRDSAKRYIADDAAKPNPIGFWKTLIQPWMVKDSGAYKYSRRPDVLEVDLFFDELIRRQKKDSSDYDSSLRDYFNDLSTPDSVDVHYRTAYEFYTKFMDEKLALTLINEFTQILDFGNSLDDPFFATVQGRAVKERLIEQQRERIVALIKKNKEVTVEASCKRDIQGIVAADPSLFLKLKSNQPLTGTAGELTDWFQTSILDVHDGKPHDIALKIGRGIVNPLTPCKQKVNVNNNNIINQQQTQQQQKAGNNNNNSKRNHQQFAGVPPNQQQPFAQKKQKFQQNGQPSNKQPKTIGPKYCGWCKHNFKGSTAYSFHDGKDCFRNPKSASFDPVKAAISPKK